MSQDPECLKNGLPRPRKINKSVKQDEWNLLEKNYAITEFSNDFNPTNLSNPSSLQINSQLVARGAGGRGEALGSAPTPQGVKGVLGPQFSSSVPEVLEAQGESAPAAGPYPKVHQKFIKNRIRKKLRFLIPNGLPKGPSKSQKSHQISKMAPSNSFGELLWPLSFQKGFPSRSQGPPEPQKRWFYYSKTTVFRNPL